MAVRHGNRRWGKFLLESPSVKSTAVVLRAAFGGVVRDRLQRDGERGVAGENQRVNERQVQPVVQNALFRAETQEKLEIGFAVLGAVGARGGDTGKKRGGAADGFKDFLNNLQAGHVLEKAGAFGEGKGIEFGSQSDLIVVEAVVGPGFRQGPDNAREIPVEPAGCEHARRPRHAQKHRERDRCVLLGDSLNDEGKASAQFFLA